MKSLLLTTVFAGLSLGATVTQAASLTILHNNDGESKLLPVSIDGNSYAGASRFVTAVDTLRAAAQGAGRDVLTLSSGDNFLAGPTFNASLANGVFYDALVLDRIGYDGVTLGNHEFDFGPAVLADFIGATAPTTTFLSANLDFSGEAGLNALALGGRIVSSKVVTQGANSYGIVGATTEALKSISSPGNVGINPVVAAVQAEVDTLIAGGVNKIIFSSHLQDLTVDESVIGQLRGVDVLIAGGASTLFRNDLPVGAPDVFGDLVDGPYPSLFQDADGANVAVISTSGDYRYLGQIEVEFDAGGQVIAVGAGSGPVLIDDSFALDPYIETEVVAPVQAYVDALDMNVVATSEVGLDGRRESVRTGETNLGSLIADGFLYAVEQFEAAAGVPLTSGDPRVSLVNGGGIRNNNVIAPGELTELDTFGISPFGNFVSVIEGMTGEQLKTVLEWSVRLAPAQSGGFGQIGGMSIIYDPSRAFGERIFDITLADGTKVYRAGNFLYDGTVDFVTANFLARGGDGYPFPDLGLDFFSIGVTDQLALANYLSVGLGGVVSADMYPEGGLGRITAAAVPEVSTWAMLIAGFGIVGGAMRRRRGQAFAG